MHDKNMKQSKRVQIASESAVKVTTRKVNDTVAAIEIDDKLMSDEHNKMLLTAVADLLQENVAHIVLDLTKLKRINSSGLGSMISAYTSAVNRNAIIKIGGINHFVQNVLNITKLNEVFEIFSSVDDAVKSFEPPTA